MSSPILRVALALASLVLSLALPAHAGPSPATPPPIPEPLRPWIDWVAPAGYRCASGLDGKPVCVWPGRLDLEVDDKGGTFRLEARLDEGESLPLPGSDQAWPLDVKVDDTPGVVLSSGGPRLSVGRGPHSVTGRFAWAVLPASLRIPAEIGLLRSLRVRGAVITSPNRDKDGVSLVAAATDPSPPTGPTTVGDQVEVRVVRLLVTERPMGLKTWIRLNVSGKARELLLGPALPEGFAALSLLGKWPAHLDADGRIRVRVDVGEGDLVLDARAPQTPTEIRRPAVTGTWTTGDEVWAFQDRDPFHVNTVEGPPRVPNTTVSGFVGGTQEGNCFAMKDGASLRLVAQPRLAAGNREVLRLHRVFSIAGDGSGISVADTIGGTFSAPTRLEFSPGLIAGEAGIAGHRQVLGSVDGRPAGFEVPAASEASVYASAWLPRVPRLLPLDAFGRTYHSRQVTVQAQAGWLPLYLPGSGGGLVDAIAAGDVLLLALVVALMFAAYGFRLALLAGVTLLLCLLLPKLPLGPFVAVAVMGTVVVRAPPKRRSLALVAHGALVVFAALTMLKTTRTCLLLAFEPESVQLQELADESAATSSGESGGSGGMHKGAEGMMGDPSQNALQPAPIAYDSEPSNKKSDTEAKKPKEFELRARSYDPNSLPQFGPGSPSRTWLSLTMTVPEGQSSVRAIMLPPAATALLALLRVSLSVALLVALLRFRPKGPAAATPPAPPVVAGATLALLSVLAAMSPAAHAQTPDHAALDDLKARLAAPPACRPNCAQVARVALEARKRSLVLRMEVHAGEALALPLPSGFPVVEVLVDKRPAELTRLEPNLLARLEPGIHEVTITGTLTEDTTAIAFGALPARLVQPLLDGWTLEGVGADGAGDPVLKLVSQTPGTPAPAAATKAPSAKGALAVMLAVYRELDFDIEWKVRTTVARLPPISTVPGGRKSVDESELQGPALPQITTDVALLAGESIVSDAGTHLTPHDGKVTVTLEGAKQVSWTSTLAFQPGLTLVAPVARDHFETWSYTSSSRWRVTTGGVRALPEGGGASFAPWPGETLALTLVRPTGLPGATARIENSELTTTDHGASLTLRASAAQIGALGWSVELPDGYEIDPEARDSNWVLDGRTLRLRGSHVTLSLRRPRRALDAVLAVAPKIKVSAAGVSATTTLETRDWVVFNSATQSTEGGRLSGSLIGLAMAIAFAFVARVLGEGLRTTGIAAAAGLMSTNSRSLLAVAALVALALVLVARQRWVTPGRHTAPTPAPEPVPAEGPSLASKPITHPGYTLMQLGFGALVIAAVGGFVVVSVMQALYGEPTGAKGAITTASWFLDRHAGVLPGATLVTLPMVAYRLVMVAWLAAWAYLLRALAPWAWAAFSTGGPIHREPRPTANPPSEPDPAG